MKYSSFLTSVVVFRPDPPRGRSRAETKQVTGGPFLQRTSSSDRKATATLTNRMHSIDLEACGKKRCFFIFFYFFFFWGGGGFHSEVEKCVLYDKSFPLGLLILIM